MFARTLLLRTFIITLLCASFCLALAGCTRKGPPAPITHYGGTNGAGSAGIHAVMPGDTLYSISQRYKIAMRDIVFANHLSAPFTLKVGQRLALPPPQEYRVRDGDTLYAVSRIFEVSVNELASLNHITPPYTLHTGETLTLPSRAPTSQQQYTKTYSAGNYSTSAGKAVPAPSVQSGPVDTKTASAVPAQKPTRPVKVTTQTPARSSSKFLTPVQGKVVSSYGAKSGGLHNDGINIAAPKGTPVAAAENGVIVYVGNELKGSGNLVLIRHADRWMSAYAHLDTTTVKRGQTIKRGAQLGTVGATGSVSTPQLHFELRRGTQAINPKLYL